MMTADNDPLVSRPPEHLRTPVQTERELYAAWLAKSDERRKQKQQRQRERDETVTRNLELRTAIVLGRSANDGRGHCRWCGLVLGQTSEGEYTHPAVRECSGPAPEPCTRCARPWQWDATERRWAHDCTTAPRIGFTRAPQIERVRTPGDGDRGLFGYRRGDD